MKKFIAFILTAMLLTANANAIDLYVDFGRLNTDAPPASVGGRTLVPVRAIFEALGAAVEWDAATRTATGASADATVIMQIDNRTAYVNGEAKTLDVPAQLINGRTMVPARFISEALGYDVTWYQPTQTAAIAYQMKGYGFYVSEDGDLYHFNSTCNENVYREAVLAEVMGRNLLPCLDCVPADIATVHYETPQPEPAPVTEPADNTIEANTAETSTPSAGSTPNGGGSVSSSVTGGSSAVSSGNGNNFNTYDNESQQNTTATYVLNMSTKKFHKPSCRSVKKIASKNYGTSSSSRSSLISKGYSPCGICHP